MARKTESALNLKLLESIWSTRRDFKVCTQWRGSLQNEWLSWEERTGRRKGDRTVAAGWWRGESEGGFLRSYCKKTEETEPPLFPTHTHTKTKSPEVPELCFIKSGGHCSTWNLVNDFSPTKMNSKSLTCPHKLLQTPPPKFNSTHTH